MLGLSILPLETEGLTQVQYWLTLNSQEREAAITEAEGRLVAAAECSNPLPSSKC